MAAPTTERPIIAEPTTQQPTAKPAGFTTQQETKAAPADRHFSSKQKQHRRQNMKRQLDNKQLLP